MKVKYCGVVRMEFSVKQIYLILKATNNIFEPPHGKPNNLHRRKGEKTKAQISFAVPAKLISSFAGTYLRS